MLPVLWREPHLGLPVPRLHFTASGRGSLVLGHKGLPFPGASRVPKSDTACHRERQNVAEVGRATRLYRRFCGYQAVGIMKTQPMRPGVANLW